MRGVSYLGGVLNRNTDVELRRGGIEKGFSSKTLCTNSIESVFPFLGWKLSDVNDVASNWATNFLMLFN